MLAVVVEGDDKKGQKSDKDPGKGKCKSKPMEIHVVLVKVEL